MLRIDKRVLNQISYKEKDLYPTIILLHESHLRNQTTFYGTPSVLYNHFHTHLTISRNKRTQFIQSLIRLVNNNVIKIVSVNNAPYKNTLRWNDTILFDCSNLTHQPHKPFTVINSKDIIKIVECTSMDFQTLLQVYINITSYFNNLDITRADKKELNLDMELYSTLPNISCYASLQTICDTRYSQDENGEHWIAINTLYKAIDALEELKLLSTIKPFKPKGCDQNFTNHYCYPRHTKLCQAIANMRVKRILYQKKLTK